MDIQQVKQYMKNNHITYDELASKSGISISTLKKIFSGVSQYPRLDTVQAIERALGLDAIPKETDEEEQWRTLFKELTEEELEELTTFVDYLLAKRDKKKPHHNGRANN